MSTARRHAAARRRLMRTAASREHGGITFEVVLVWVALIVLAAVMYAVVSPWLTDLLFS